MKKNTKIIVILIIAILILATVAFVWKSYTILPDGYTVINSSNRKPAGADSIPTYDMRMVEVDYVPYTPIELMIRSDLIISGRVLSISESKWSTPDGQKPEEVYVTHGVGENGNKFAQINYPINGEYIYTDIDVQVDKRHKGKLNSEIITIRLKSGAVGEFSKSADGGLNDRNYNEGDEVFLFLKSYGNKTDGLYYIPTPQCALIKLQNI